MDILPIIKKALDNLTNADKKESFMKLIRSIADGKLPLNNISFELFLDVVNWFSVDDTRSMRYSPSTLKFFGWGVNCLEANLSDLCRVLEMKPTY